MTADRLRFDSGDRIEVGYVSDLYELLRAIDVAMPKDAVLYLEGTSIAPEITHFLASREASDPREVEPNTSWPKPTTFHMPLQGRNLEQLRELAGRHAEPEVCDHLVVYRDNEVLLWAHDAGAGHVEMAQSLPEATRDRLRSTLGAALRG